MPFKLAHLGASWRGACAEGFVPCEVAEATRSEQASSRLPRALADRTGETLTQVVVVALRERFEHERRKSRRQELIEEMKEIAERVKTMPVRDHRSAEEIIGYNEFGAFDSEPGTGPASARHRFRGCAVR